MPHPFTLIIPAAGSGQRMESEIPKPFISVAGRTVLARTIDLFVDLPGLRQIIIATSRELADQTEEIVSEQFTSAECRIVEGGESRQASVLSGLREVEFDNGLVAIHDAVRPFTDRGQILNCLERAHACGAAILAIPVNDTIKEVGPGRVISSTPSREVLWRAQTPQIFRHSLIFRAHTQAETQGFKGTDDASLVEWLGEPVEVVEGSVANLKLTYPLDMKLAELIVKQEDREVN